VALVKVVLCAIRRCVACWMLASRCPRPTGRHALSKALRALNRKQDGGSRIMCTRFDHLDHKQVKAARWLIDARTSRTG
jgi:hypothetical protein